MNIIVYYNSYWFIKNTSFETLLFTPYNNFGLFNFCLSPFQGTAYSVCGGPPCQGISGFNRFRNKNAPLEDKKNQQLLVFLDIIDFLKPKYVLMENVVDLLRFSKGFVARYAVASLVAMNYQTRLGMMTAGSYGVPQLRNRVFLWAAQPTEVNICYIIVTTNMSLRT